MLRLFPLALIAGLATAQEPVRVGVGVIERKLTLDDALQLALKNNLEIEIERTNISSASVAVEAARGAFDGLVRWQPGYEKRNSPTSSILFGADGKLVESFHNQNFSYVQRTPWHGGMFQGFFDNNRTATSNPFVGLNPTVTSRLGFSYTQPLFRNRLVDRERAEINIRSKAVDISGIDLEIRVVDIIGRAEAAYWDLVAARQDVRVKADGVEWAREQLARNRRMIETGTLAPVELAASEAELERRQDLYFSTVGFVTQVENQLKTLIAASRQDPLWNDVIVPVDENTVEEPLDDLAEANALAIRKRPELRHLSLRGESNDIQKGLANDQLKPKVDLVGTYFTSGLAGTQSLASNPFSESTALTTRRLNELSALAGLPALPTQSFGGIPSSLVGGYGSNVSNLFGGSFQTVQIGVSMDWNMNNRAAKAALSQTAVTERRLRLERDRWEQAITAQVRNALQSLETARQRITAAEAGARAANEKLESETRLFQAGESTNFFVLTRQNDYQDALRRVLVSKLDYNKALAQLHQATGMTLETHKITVK